MIANPSLSTPLPFRSRKKRDWNKSPLCAWSSVSIDFTLQLLAEGGTRADGWLCSYDWNVLSLSRPGDLNRLSSDGSVLLGKSGGYAGVSGFLHHQSSPAFQQHLSPQVQQLHHSLHQSQPALVAAVGKSPSRDLGGGSTPILKSNQQVNRKRSDTLSTCKGEFVMGNWDRETISPFLLYDLHAIVKVCVTKDFRSIQPSLYLARCVWNKRRK